MDCRRHGWSLLHSEKPGQSCNFLRRLGQKVLTSGTDDCLAPLAVSSRELSGSFSSPSTTLTKAMPWLGHLPLPGVYRQRASGAKETPHRPQASGGEPAAHVCITESCRRFIITAMGHKAGQKYGCRQGTKTGNCWSQCALRQTPHTDLSAPSG